MAFLRPSHLFYIRILIFTAGGFALAYLVLSSALEKGISDKSRLVLLTIALATAFAFWKVTPGVPRSFNRTAWMQPKTPALLMSVFLNVIAVVSGAIGMVAPRTAVEHSPGALEDLGNASVSMGKDLLNDTAEIKGALGVGKRSLVFAKIGRIWGEIDCQVTYRFRLVDRALTVDSLKSEGLRSRQWVFTVENDGDLTARNGARRSLLTATEVKGYFPGQSVKFLYETNGVTQALSWDGDDPDQNKLDLIPCPDPGHVQ
ncbi:MAG: hypothetical protein KBF53_14210 [Sphingobium sp.]|nr:hypothetical protein [Sphingobium sp.]